VSGFQFFVLQVREHKIGEGGDKTAEDIRRERIGHRPDLE
jgi:hypothetical protein